MLRPKPPRPRRTGKHSHGGTHGGSAPGGGVTEGARDFARWHHTDGRPEGGGMFFSYGVHQRRLMGPVVAALAAVLVSSCGGGGDSQEDSAADTTSAGGGQQASTADLDAALKKSFRESDAPGVVAAVQTPDYTWVRALGVADRASKEPMTPDVHQRIGSVTKTFTATLLLQAQAEGLLSLDDTIDQYVKGVPNGDKITLQADGEHDQRHRQLHGGQAVGGGGSRRPEAESGSQKSWRRLASRIPLCSSPVPSGSTPTRTTCCSVWSSSR